MQRCMHVHVAATARGPTLPYFGGCNRLSFRAKEKVLISYETRKLMNPLVLC